MKVCPECGDTDVNKYDADTDECNSCLVLFDAVEDQEEVYCYACSLAGGAKKSIYHLPPVCR